VDSAAASTTNITREVNQASPPPTHSQADSEQPGTSSLASSSSRITGGTEADVSIHTQNNETEEDENIIMPRDHQHSNDTPPQLVIQNNTNINETPPPVTPGRVVMIVTHPFSHPGKYLKIWTHPQTLSRPLMEI